MKSLFDLIKFILLELIPIIIGKILLIFLWRNNLLLTFLYLVIIGIAFKIKYEKREIFIFLLGAIVGLLFEVESVLIGFEIFLDPFFFGIPLWMPLTWGYGFVVIKRISIAISEFGSK